MSMESMALRRMARIRVAISSVGGGEGRMVSMGGRRSGW